MHGSPVRDTVLGEFLPSQGLDKKKGGQKIVDLKTFFKQCFFCTRT